MELTNIETLYGWLDQTAETVQQHTDDTYLDSLLIAMDTLFHQQPPEHPDDLLTHKLETALSDTDFTVFSSADIRKAIQLAILKGTKAAVQQQHLMTPEAVALFVGYLADKLMQGKGELRLFDPVSGTANLLTVVLDQLKQPVIAYGGEVDPTLIQLAALNANLQKKQIEFFHQDSLRPFLLDPVDLVVADLPVGYYPDDVRAAQYQLKAEEGHSYSHHLLIEQSMNYTKPGGYLIFIIPDFLFDSDQSDQLHAYIREYAHIIGVIRLPESAFKSEKNIKSIFILQKKSGRSEAPKQPLLAKLPSFNNAGAMDNILSQMNAWFAEYIG
jgi:site-specific DNA-methyltransferase (adenine-specific)